MQHEKDSLYLIEQRDGTFDYRKEYTLAVYREKSCTTPIYMATESNYIVIDLCDRLKLNYMYKELHQLYGLNISAFCDIVKCEPTHQMISLTASYQDVYDVNGTDSAPCSEYNIHVSVVRKQNQDIIVVVTERLCKPWNIRHFFRAAPHQIPSVVTIYLDIVLMPDLLLEDLLYFPNLQELLLGDMPLASESLENKLLCSSPHLKLFSFENSLGHLRKFPSHIFNCSRELEIEIIIFSNHNTAY